MNDTPNESAENVQARQDIVRFMAEQSYHPLKPKDLAKALNIPQSGYGDFRRLLRAMLASGEIIRLKRGRLAVPADLDLIRGRVHAHRKGFAFVIPDDGSPDIYIDSDHIKTAMHSDTVLVQKLSQSHRGQPEGRIVRVVKRGRPKIVGTFKRGRHFSFVVPEDERMPRDVYIPADATLDAVPDQMVVVELSGWDDPARPPEGKVSLVLGFPNAPGVDVLTVIHTHGLELDFPPDVEAEAEAFSAEPDARELKGRKDCRDLAVVTIDPADARDHDDALSVVELANGRFEVGVHIADVSHYVQPGTSLDREALLRGTSVYLVDRVIPMLPERLSTDLCSLRAGEDRLALTCFLQLDSEAKLVSYRLAETVVRSVADLSYEQVQNFYDTGDLGPSLEQVKPSLNTLLHLSKHLTRRRLRAGSLDFDLPDSRIELNPDGSVKAIHEQARLSSHRLVEEFMLLANRTVAKYLETVGIPVLYRVHDKPDAERIAQFAELVQSLGLKFKAGPDLSSRHLQKVVAEVKGKKEEGLINEVLLRTMSKAVYQPENIGHFGLAFDRYVHFTSPIRRYPDLGVHRAVRRRLQKQATPAWISEQKQMLPRVGRHTSARERVAMEAERDSIRIKRIAYMETQIGEEFNGIITGVRNFGLFVKLDRILVEGLIPLGTLEDDYYHVDELRYTATGRNTGRTFRMGDAVTVQVARVDPSSKQVDFHLIKEEKPRSLRRGRTESKSRSRPKAARRTGRPKMSKPKASRSGRRKGAKP